jgi:hypothetical protein
VPNGESDLVTHETEAIADLSIQQICIDDKMKRKNKKKKKSTRNFSVFH